MCESPGTGAGVKISSPGGPDPGPPYPIIPQAQTEPSARSAMSLVPDEPIAVTAERPGTLPRQRDGVMDELVVEVLLAPRPHRAVATEGKVGHTVRGNGGDTREVPHG